MVNRGRKAMASASVATLSGRHPKSMRGGTTGRAVEWIAQSHMLHTITKRRRMVAWRKGKKIGHQNEAGWDEGPLPLSIRHEARQDLAAFRRGVGVCVSRLRTALVL